MASSIALNPPFNKSMCRSLFCSFRERKRRGVTAARNVPNSRGSRGGGPLGDSLGWPGLGLPGPGPGLASVKFRYFRYFR